MSVPEVIVPEGFLTLEKIHALPGLIPGELLIRYYRFLLSIARSPESTSMSQKEQGVEQILSEIEIMDTVAGLLNDQFKFVMGYLTGEKIGNQTMVYDEDDAYTPEDVTAYLSAVVRSLV